MLQTTEYARLALAFGRGADEEDAARAAAVRVEAPGRPGPRLRPGAEPRTRPARRRDRPEPACPVDYTYLGRLARPDGNGNVLVFTGIHPQGTLGVVDL
ncbi:hypothetical protein ABZV22_27665, partial [Streptosporangium canum]